MSKCGSFINASAFPVDAGGSRHTSMSCDDCDAGAVVLADTDSESAVLPISSECIHSLSHLF